MEKFDRVQVTAKPGDPQRVSLEFPFCWNADRTLGLYQVGETVWMEYLSAGSDQYVPPDRRVDILIHATRPGSPLALERGEVVHGRLGHIAGLTYFTTTYAGG